jgi:DNA-binding MarR family transcriptional regulator
MSAISSTSSEQLLRELHGVVMASRDLWRELAPGQTRATLAALAAVQRVAPARISAVAEELHVDVSVASRQLAALEADGLISREADPTDRRSQLVSPTTAGTARLEDAGLFMAEALERRLGDWSPEELADLLSGLARLREALSSTTTVSTEGGAR